KTVNDWMRAFYTRQIWVRIAKSADHRTGRMNAEDVGKPEVPAALIGFGVHAGLEGRQQRTALLYIGAQLAALLVAQKRDVGQDQCRVFLEPLGLQPVFVH